MAPTVLVVDDNVSLAENLSEILTDSGFESTCVGSPKEALAAVEQRAFDVVLLDMRMPEMDGVALHALLSKSMPRASFILMTAFASDERIGAARAAGIRDILSKPFAPGALLALVGRARACA